MRLRGTSVRARALEWVATRGAEVMARTSARGPVGGVGDVDHHAEGVHFADDVAAEGGEAVVAPGVSGPEDVGQVVGVGPGEGHVTDAEAVEVAEAVERIFNGVAAFDAEEEGEIFRRRGRRGCRRG